MGAFGQGSTAGEALSSGPQLRTQQSGPQPCHPWSHCRVSFYMEGASFLLLPACSPVSCQCSSPQEESCAVSLTVPLTGLHPGKCPWLVWVLNSNLPNSKSYSIALSLPSWPNSRERECGRGVSPGGVAISSVFPLQMGALSRLQRWLGWGKEPPCFWAPVLGTLSAPLLPP